MAEARLEQRRDNDVEQAMQNQQASKQAVGVNELSWRKDEERLQSVAFFEEGRTERIWPTAHARGAECSWTVDECEGIELSGDCSGDVR
jgi:hypothetical protein